MIILPLGLGTTVDSAISRAANTWNLLDTSSIRHDPQDIRTGTNYHRVQRGITL